MERALPKVTNFIYRTKGEKSREDQRIWPLRCYILSSKAIWGYKNGRIFDARHESLKVSGSRRRSNLAIDFMAKALIYATDARNRREKERTPVRKLSDYERLYRK